MYRYRRLVATLTMVALPIVLTACAEEHPAAAPSPAAPDPDPTPTASAPAAGPIAATCPPDAGYPSNGELRGVTDNAQDSLWALLFLREPRLGADVETKIVWRMTGSGTFDIEATGPYGVVVEPIWGPDLHDGSSWNRPGDEWGTGWNFPTAGCWTVQADRSNGVSGSLTLRIG